MMATRTPDRIAPALDTEAVRQHERDYATLAERLERRGVRVDELVGAVGRFEVAVPSWAFGAGGGFELPGAVVPPAGLRPRAGVRARGVRGAPRRVAAVHRAQTLRAGLLRQRRAGLGLVAPPRAGAGRAGAVPRRPRSPPAQH